MRLPFDPDRASGPPEPPDGSSGETPISVTDLSALIRGALERIEPSSVRVIGSVSNLKCPNHWYFSLKDEGALVSCVAWARDARRFESTPDEGEEVIVTGSLGHYAPQGRTQLYVKTLEPVGAGALEIRFRALCEELRRAGYFADDRKRPLPLLPAAIAVITSRGAAALADVRATALGRFPAVRLVHVDVRVQGEGAAQEVARAITWVDRHRQRLGVEAILVTRGGGSVEDLWAFNERVVADSAHACTLPLVAAIGHESDTCVLELVADCRASTPTQAVILLMPDREQLREQVVHLRHALHGAMAARIACDRLRLEQATLRLERSRPETHGRQRERLVRLEGRLRAAVARGIDVRPRLVVLRNRLVLAVNAVKQRHRQNVESLSRRLRSVGPEEVLRRGYSLTTDSSGRLVRRIASVPPGAIVRTRVADGVFESEVIASNAGQMDLFQPTQ